MKSLFPIFLLITLGSAACRQVVNNQQAASDRPNVLLIITDDQGYGDLGFTGNRYIQTPHLDQLAKESAWFTNFYVSPVCAPTRSSIMTGKFSLRTGIYDTFNGGAMMDTNETTIAELLRDNGYRTAIYGKWHLGDVYPFRPGDQGFDESLIHHGGGIGQVGDPSNFYRNDSSYFDPVLFRNNEKIKTKGYCSDVFTDGALSFVEQKSDDPFFVYLAFNAPHTPLQVPQEWYDKYKNLGFDSAEARQRGMLLPQMNDAEKENARRVYGMVTNIDDNVGRIMEALRKNGKLDHTLVIFLSDNGPQNKRYNDGLRALKGDTYEGGVKSPCLFRFPKLFKPGSTIPAVAAHIDLLPTIADICGAPLPSSLDIDGKSMLPLAEGKEAESFMSRNIYEQWGRMFPERYQNMSVRKGFYKLVAKADYNAPISAFELYNTESDPSEKNNIAASHPEMVKQLKTELDAWYTKEVVENGNPKAQYMILDPEHEDTLLLNRNDAKGTPEIWGNDFIYGYWDVEVAKAGNYDVTLYFREDAGKPGRMFVKQQPLQYSVANADTNVQSITMKNMFLKSGKGPLEVFYKTGWSEVVLPFLVEITATHGK